jgi:hypothetical protein
VGDSWFHGAVCKQKYELWLRVGYNKLCTDKDMKLCVEKDMN